MSVPSPDIAQRLLDGIITKLNEWDDVSYSVFIKTSDKKTQWVYAVRATSKEKLVITRGILGEMIAKDEV